MAEYLNREQFVDRVHRELGVKNEGNKETRHPKSGYKVEVGRRFRVVPGSSPPEQRVEDHGHFPGRGQTARPVMMLPNQLGTRPVKYVYRGVSEEDFQGIQQRGSMKSDERGNIACDEGTCASHDPFSAASYLPFRGAGRILKIKVHPDDNWRVDTRDNYIKTQNAIPAERIVRHTGVFNKDQMGRYVL